MPVSPKLAARVCRLNLSQSLAGKQRAPSGSIMSRDPRFLSFASIL